MLEKLKSRLKYKLMNWLEIKPLQNDYKEYIRKNNINIFNHENNIKHYDTLLKDNWKATERNFNELSRKCINTYSEQQEQINALNRTLQSVISVGADIDTRPHEGSRSWAVVCIEGRYNVVKFVDLHGQDYRHILDFLKQFECSRRVIDTPYKEMFLENLRF